jgi:hypothetical protein
MEANKGRPAPYVVAAYAAGENALPTLRPARDLWHAAELARQQATGAIVRVYRLAPGDCQLVLNVRM